MNENDRVILQDALYCINCLKDDPNFTITHPQYEWFTRIESDIETVLKHHEVLEGIYTDSLPQGCSLCSVKSFQNAVDSGNFTDYDGFGKPAKKINGVMKMAQAHVRPSSWTRDIYADTTHIVWFNR